LLVWVVVKERPAELAVYIAARQRPHDDRALKNLGMTEGTVHFAIPALGIQFRCRAEGNLLDLEFGAFFTALNFVHRQLKNLKAERIKVLSSRPQLVFALSDQSSGLKPGSQRRRLLRKYQKVFQLSVAYVPPARNAASRPVSDMPALPENSESPLDPQRDDGSGRFRPILRGIRIGADRE
jgi:hypothetical protein